jgi:hypothetical protein
MRIELSLKDLMFLIGEFKDEIIYEEDLEHFINYTEEEHTIEIVNFND